MAGGQFCEQEWSLSVSGLGAMHRATGLVRDRSAAIVQRQSIERREAKDAVLG
jgi:hypothetical protein